MSTLTKLRERSRELKEKIEQTSGGALGRIGRLEQGLGSTAERIEALKAELGELHGDLLAEAERKHAEREQEAQRREGLFREELAAIKAHSEEVLAAVLDMSETVEKGVEAIQTYGGEPAPLALPAPSSLDASLAEAKRQIAAGYADDPMRPTIAGTLDRVKEIIVQVAAENAAASARIEMIEDRFELELGPEGEDAFRAEMDRVARLLGVLIREPGDDEA